MNIWLKREWYVAMHGQPRSFRTKKWIVILVVAAVLYRLRGWGLVLWVFAPLGLIGICAHFYLRHKTGGWRREWKFVKAIPTPYD
ncbi:hypothetical protein KW800_01670 [Candidatus Parcubacteria bacterium]|nr:hypothetical protein [Candidatus Parcubacteria bacterium]